MSTCSSRIMQTLASAPNKLNKSYEEAVCKLNTLQKNPAALEKYNKERRHRAQNNLTNDINSAKRIGLTLDKLDTLSIIHVSGTKGKGSVCTFCESILSANGVNTGFYSSPHLVEVRERIRINGKPLSKKLFTEYFYTVFNRLEDSKTSDDDDDTMPAYPRFLTLMAYHVFLEEKVDVAIMEVSCGGAYDCSNIHRCPTVVGIASLGLDHTGLLGSTIKEIAWHKAGICKPGRPAFTVQQPEDGLDVIFETAKTNKVSHIHCCPRLSSYDFHGHPIKIGLSGEHQHINASLALQLCKTWMEDKQRGITFQTICDKPSKQKIKQSNGDETHDAAVSCDMPVAEPFVLPDSFIKGLKDCYWPGRNQSFTRGHVTYYLDGAHTPRSMKACQKWFEDAATAEASTIDGNIARILVFNSTGDRDEHTLIQMLVSLQFDGIVFCPNITSVSTAQNSADQTNYSTTSSQQMSRCVRNQIKFDKLLNQSAGQHIASQQLETAVSSKTHSKDNSIDQPRSNPLAYHLIDKNHNCTQESNSSPVANSSGFSHRKVHTKVIALSCIQDALCWAACAKDSEMPSPSAADPTPPEACRTASHIQVLVTGSMHLVGGVIKVLDTKLVLKK